MEFKTTWRPEINKKLFDYKIKFLYSISFILIEKKTCVINNLFLLDNEIFTRYSGYESKWPQYPESPESFYVKALLHQYRQYCTDHAEKKGKIHFSLNNPEITSMLDTKKKRKKNL